MRKLLVIICSAALIVGMVGIAGAIPFADSQNLAKRIPGTENHSWENDSLQDSRAPNSVKNPKNANVNGQLVIDDNINIILITSPNESFNKSSWLTSGIRRTDFTNENIVPERNSVVPLPDSQAYKNMKGFELISSIFKLNDGTGSLLLPETAALILLGLGLVGLSVFGRKKLLPKFR